MLIVRYGDTPMLRPSFRVPVARLALLLTVAVLVLTVGATPRHAAPAPIQITVGGCWSDPLQGGAFVRIAEGFNKVQSAIHVKGVRGMGTTAVGLRFHSFEAAKSSCGSPTFTPSFAKVS